MKTKWGPVEHQQLEGLIGDVPWAIVPRVYNTWAAKNGYPLRTRTAMERRMEKHGWQRTVVGEWITTGVIVRTLGVSYEAAHWWIKKGWLPAVKHGSRWYLRRRDLVRMSRDRPHVLSRFPRSSLLQLLESERLADELASCHQHPGRARAVVCVETGLQFSSIKEAARTAAFVTPQRLSQVLDTTNTANGLHWKSLNRD